MGKPLTFQVLVNSDHYWSCLFERGVSCNSGWPWIRSLAEDDLQLLFLLPLPTKCWDYRCSLFCLVSGWTQGFTCMPRWHYTMWAPSLELGLFCKSKWITLLVQLFLCLVHTVLATMTPCLFLSFTLSANHKQLHSSSLEKEPLQHPRTQWQSDDRPLCLCGSL